MAIFGIIFCIFLLVFSIIFLFIIPDIEYFLPLLSYLILVIILLFAFSVKSLKKKKIVIYDLDENMKLKYRKIAGNLFLKGKNKEQIVKILSKEGLSKEAIENLLDVF